MKLFYPPIMLAILMISCRNPKEDIVNEQQELKKKISGARVRLEANETLKNHASLKLRRKYDTLQNKLSLTDQNGFNKLMDQMSAEAQDSMRSYNIYKDSISAILQSYEARYDSLEMELKRY